ncbi:MAG TPA: trypsin-like peptidase domain-containing protein [Ktedonobacterales bacterium]
MRSVSPFDSGRRHAVTAVIFRALIGLTSLVLLTIAGMPPAAAKDRPPGGALANPAVRAIDLASPAVVRIATIYSAQLTLAACGMTTTLPSSGAYSVGGVGSGAFVSAHGDILTAAHVVDIDRQSLDAEIFASGRASTDVAAFLNVACHPAMPVTPNDVASGIVQFNNFPFTTRYSAPHVLVWRSASYLGTVGGASATPAASLLTGLMEAPYSEASVTTSSAFGEDDLALLHVQLNDTPSIQLGSSSQVAVEDTLAVIGFPGNGDVNGDPTNLLTPSVNNVSVSALKHNDNGSQLIQVGGNVEHGDSGGPALDANGHIVGIVSFGGVDQGITAFLRSSDSALSLLKSAHIDTAPGTFQTLWQQAFTDYANAGNAGPGHWHTTAHEMDALRSRYPDFHGLDPYRAYAANAAIREDQSPSLFGLSWGLPVPLPIAGALAGGVALLLLVLVITLGIRRAARRRARQQRAMMPPLQQTWSAPGQPPAYAGATASPYPQSTYNAAAPAYPSSQPRPVSAPIPAGPVPADGYGMRSADPTPAPDTGAVAEVCVNGHQMLPGAFRCQACGAERAQSATSATPWAQNW